MIIFRHDLFAAILTCVCLTVCLSLEILVGRTASECVCVYMLPKCVLVCVCVCHFYDQRVTFLCVTEHSSLIVCKEYYIWLEKQMTSF